MARSIHFTPIGFEEYIAWRTRDDQMLDRINQLLKETARDPFKGIGKPEPLKGKYHGFWSRRISQEHRLIYKVEGGAIVVVKCAGHYDDK